MRISKHEQEIIKAEALQQFGADSKVFLFGSRIDDSKRGGDIDLMIETTGSFADALRKKIQFLVNVKNELGDQKIDVLLSLKNREKQSKIIEIAYREGIEL